ARGAGARRDRQLREPHPVHRDRPVLPHHHDPAVVPVTGARGEVRVRRLRREMMTSSATAAARATGTPLISITNLQKSFGSNKVLTDTSLDVDKGEVGCVIGPSGSGKSTMLRCIHTLEDPTGGSIVV